MAITYVESGSLGSNSNVNPVEFSYNCTPESGATLIISVAAGTYTSSVSFNGVAATLVGRHTYGGLYGELWYLTNPTSGTHTISINYGGGSGYTSIAVATYTGIKATTPVNTYGVSGASGNTTTSVVITETSYLILAGLAYYTIGGDIVGTTTRIKGSTSYSNQAGIFDSNGLTQPKIGPFPVHMPALSYSLSHSLGDGYRTVGVVGAFLPA